MSVRHALLDADLSDPLKMLEAFEWALSGVRHMMEQVKLSPGDGFVNPHLLLDVLVHTKKGLAQYDGPDEFKTGGHLCFWISRIKPFRAFLERNRRFTNEAMALQIGLSIVRETKGRKPIPDSILANLLYELRYGFASPIGVTHQFQLLYC